MPSGVNTTRVRSFCAASQGVSIHFVVSTSRVTESGRVQPSTTGRSICTKRSATAGPGVDQSCRPLQNESPSTAIAIPTARAVSEPSKRLRRKALKRNVIKAPTPVSESKSANVTPIGPPNGANDAHGVSSVAKAGVSQPKSNPPAPQSHSAAVSVSASAIHRSALREGVSHIATHAAAAQQSAQTAASSTSPTQASTSGKRPNSCIERTDHSNPIVKAASANKNPKNAAWAGLCAETINPSPKSRAVSPHRCADHGANAAA